MFFDTHCHIHSKDYKIDFKTALKEAKQNGVNRLILVGEDVDDSKLAVEAARSYDLLATVGVHPHEAKKASNIEKLSDLAKLPKVVAIGECGLDYWYEHSSRETQKQVLQFQIDLAVSNSLPMSLHIRGSRADPNDAFKDFFAIYDQFQDAGKGVSGVVHSFTGTQSQLDQALSRGLYIGVNGIITFGDKNLQNVLKNLPLQSIVLETDSPYLTPVPQRGRINAPKYVVHTAEFIAKQRGISKEEVAEITTSNAETLFIREV